MRNQERKEIDRWQKLVVPLEAGVVVATVMDQPIGAILQPLKRHGRSLHVLEQALKSLAILGVEPARAINIEARVNPRTHERDAILRCSLALKQRLEGALAEEGIKRREVEIARRGVE